MTLLTVVICLAMADYYADHDAKWRRRVSIRWSFSAVVIGVAALLSEIW